MTPRPTTLLTVLALGLAAVRPAHAAPEPSADLHADWTAVLQTHVRDGRVDYRALQAAPDRLNRYLATLAATDPAPWPRADRLAYWINAYNAFTVKLILNHYPLDSIREISEPWDRPAWTAGGTDYSLNDIEHKILREQLAEPRIHFAINCASIGCPDLWKRAFTGDAVDRQLDAAARRFLQSPRHLRTRRSRGFFGVRRDTLSVSRIFDWFKEDFTAGGTQGIADYVMPYVDDATRRFIRTAGDDLAIDYLDYDWSLNDVARD